MLSRCARSIPLPATVSSILSELTTKTADLARHALADFSRDCRFLLRAFFLMEMHALQLPSSREPFLWYSLNAFLIPQQMHALADVPLSCVLLEFPVSSKSIPYMYASRNGAYQSGTKGSDRKSLDAVAYMFSVAPAVGGHLKVSNHENERNPADACEASDF